MDFGRIIIGVFLITHSVYKFRKRRISLSRASFSFVCGLGILAQGITLSPRISLDKYLTKEQMLYWDYFGQFLTATIIVLLGRYLWELWRARKAKA